MVERGGSDAAEGEGMTDLQRTEYAYRIIHLADTWQDVARPVAVVREIEQQTARECAEIAEQDAEESLTIHGGKAARYIATEIRRRFGLESK